MLGLCKILLLRKAPISQRTDQCLDLVRELKRGTTMWSRHAENDTLMLLDDHWIGPIIFAANAIESDNKCPFHALMNRNKIVETGDEPTSKYYYFSCQ